MDLYKNKDCTEAALCPMAFSNPYITQASFYCDSSCAWCIYKEVGNVYYCGALKTPQWLYSSKENNE